MCKCITVFFHIHSETHQRILHPHASICDAAARQNPPGLVYIYKYYSIFNHYVY